MQEIHSGVCGPHMSGKALTMNHNCCEFVCKCQQCQVHASSICQVHALSICQLLNSTTSPLPFSMRGLDINVKVTPKSSNRHEYITVVICYTKWVAVARYFSITSTTIIKFIKNLIRRNGLP